MSENFAPSLPQEPSSFAEAYNRVAVLRESDAQGMFLDMGWCKGNHYVKKLGHLAYVFNVDRYGDVYGPMIFNIDEINIMDEFLGRDDWEKTLPRRIVGVGARDESVDIVKYKIEGGVSFDVRYSTAAPTHDIKRGNRDVSIVSGEIELTGSTRLTPKDDSSGCVDVNVDGGPVVVRKEGEGDGGEKEVYDSIEETPDYVWRSNRYSILSMPDPVDGGAE